MSDPASIPAFTIALGHAPVAVEHVDGRKETAQVALLKIIAYPKFFAEIADEYSLADFVCEQPNGWSKTLIPNSLMDVVEKAGELNFSAARRWVARREMLDQTIENSAQRNAVR
jgi:hypothetical protein